MTDFSAARTAMVDCQVRPSDVTKYPIIDAFLSTPRENFVPADKRAVAYVGEHIALSQDRYLLDARTFAKMLDALNVTTDDNILDLGCGLGYSTAILAKMSNFVVGVETDAELAEQAEANLSDAGIDNAYVMAGSLPQGASKHGPYDAIVFQGMIEAFPATLASQLKEGARVCAVYAENGASACKIGINRNGDITWRADFDATAPLLSEFAAERPFTFA